MIDTQTGWARWVDKLSDATMLLRTTDGGTHWKDVTPLSSSGRKVYVARITVLSPLIAWVVPAYIKGLFRTTDGGRSWRSIGVGGGDISFINPREGWRMISLNAWAGKEEVEIYRSTDGGDSWTKVASATIADDSSGLPIGGSKADITFLNSTTGWITGIFLQPDGFFLYVTHDGGRTWRQQNVPLPNELKPDWRGSPQPPKFFTAQDGILPVIHDILNASGHTIGGLITFYTTHDGGATWTHTAPVRVNVTDRAYQAVADVNHAWVLSGGVLHATSDRGRRWTTMPPNPHCADVIQLDFSSSKVGWAVGRKTFKAGGTPTFPFLLKTLDGGRTWSPLDYAI